MEGPLSEIRNSQFTAIYLPLQPATEADLTGITDTLSRSSDHFSILNTGRPCSPQYALTAAFLNSLFGAVLLCSPTPPPTLAQSCPLHLGLYVSEFLKAGPGLHFSSTSTFSACSPTLPLLPNPLLADNPKSWIPGPDFPLELQTHKSTASFTSVLGYL